EKQEADQQKESGKKKTKTKSVDEPEKQQSETVADSKQKGSDPSAAKTGLEYDEEGKLKSKQKMKDIKAPGSQDVDTESQKTSKSMGPIEEIAQMKWKHFRHLSDDPQQAAERLLQKFMLLHDESFLLFLEAREEWFDSPLYSSYQQVLKKSINEREQVDDILASKAGDFSREEFDAVIFINEELT
ncbi:MAG: hypothetical protein BRC22_00305, partial [Parcubacteria group bacterium QH_9_35_7]